jgi:DNA mismatch repair protein MSH4
VHHGANWLVVFSCIFFQFNSSVPAEYASLPIHEQLFTRISVDDGIEFNVSTFSSEMREMAFILQNVSRSSLVLVDELGRGTSATDGLAIALAICGALLESRVVNSSGFGWEKATVLFATHFKEIAMAFDGRPGFVNLHLHTEESGFLTNLTCTGKKWTRDYYELST